MALLPFLPAAALAAVLAAAVVVTLVVSAALRATILRSVRQLRWLLAAIVLVYAFLAPGDGIRWVDALARGAVLVCAVVAVRVALYGLPAVDLADGLARILAPLRHIGIASERFAHRLVLTLDAVPEVQALIARTPAPATGKPLARLAGRAATVIEAIDSELGTRNPELSP